MTPVQKPTKSPPWTRCEVTFSCGHTQWLFDTTARVSDVTDEEVGWFIRKRKDGWWAAYPCKECKRRRAVVSVGRKALPA